MVKLGLIGKTLGHSWSADYFAEKFRAEDIDGTYSLFQLPEIDRLPDLISQNPELNGLNVTIPYKESVMGYLDNCSRDARAIGAVNVIKITHSDDRKPILEGYNSDWEAFRESIRPLCEGKNFTALILGTGGAAKAVAYALQSLGTQSRLVSREKHPGDSGILCYGELTDEDIRGNKIIVNATPLGMHPLTDTFPDIPYEGITSEHICHDLVYNPEQTEFMRRCASHGAIVKNGLEMLHRQADISWEIWKGNRPIQ